jgi:hypothetical protein
MPDITLQISDEDQRLLAEEYRKMSIDWLRANASALPPPFEQWLAGELTNRLRQAAMDKNEIKELLTIDAIEQFVTSLQRHSFGLAHLGPHGNSDEAAAGLAQAVAAGLRLPPHAAKRLQELLTYYAKSARDTADLAHLGMTGRAQGALHEIYGDLIERTLKALDHLEQHRALGRVEGGAAILVGMNVMTRQAAQEKTEAFRHRARDAGA